MTTKAWHYPIIKHRGNRWRLDPPVTTSDGFLLSNGTIVHDDDDEPWLDAGGWPTIHSFFLGRAPDVATSRS